MIEILKNILQKNPTWFRNSGRELSFMKISTPTSGAELGKGKVLIFIFENGEKTPTLCVKTVRTYSAADSIKRGHTNLELLRHGLEGKKYSNMFATPLYLHDDGKDVFSVETACVGNSLSTEPSKLDLVIEKYLLWQRHALLQHGDLTPDNVLVSGDRVSFIDYDHVGRDWPPGFDLYSLIWKSKLGKEKTDAYLKKYLPPNPPFDLYREADNRRKENKT